MGKNESNVAKVVGKKMLSEVPLHSAVVRVSAPTVILTTKASIWRHQFPCCKSTILQDSHSPVVQDCTIRKSEAGWRNSNKKNGWDVIRASLAGTQPRDSHPTIVYDGENNIQIPNSGVSMSLYIKTNSEQPFIYMFHRKAIPSTLHWHYHYCVDITV